MVTSLSNFFSFILRSNPLHHRHPPNSLFLVALFKHALLPKVVQESHNSTSSLLSAELASVICPSLVYANTISFKSAYNVQVIVDENEPEEKLLNRFTREVMRAGVIQECKRRRFYENKQDEKKRKSREAAKCNRRRRPGGRFSSQNREEPSANKMEEEEDNWELPEGDIPY